MCLVYFYDDDDDDDEKGRRIHAGSVFSSKAFRDTNSFVRSFVCVSPNLSLSVYMRARGAKLYASFTSSTSTSTIISLPGGISPSPWSA